MSFSGAFLPDRAILPDRALFPARALLLGDEGTLLSAVEGLEVADVPGGVELLPGAKDLLSALPAGSWAVVSSATRRVAEARLREVGVDVPVLVAADDVAHGRPHPEPFSLGARRLGVDPADCVVLEDAPAGLAAGHAAGMRTVALTTTHPAAALFADAVVPDLSAVSVQVRNGVLEVGTEG
ncbi:HAD-IA family hydrolase [Streptomyces sp. NPDC093225]|uniref:HAD-IA family hydrolase n=1 Tax=Streptomyces sp. NPDC093225 TaxID=3366034 RepID=UPI00380216BF